MSRVISERELKDAVQEATFIKNGSERSCEGIKYDFILSDYVISRNLARAIHLSENKNIKATIAPGEVAFVMSEESLDLPDDVFCQLSAKRKLSLDGIIILGGLIVDPKYKGRLIFGLYNISSVEYPILPGKKLIAGVFFKTGAPSGAFIEPKPIEDFPKDIVRMVTASQPKSVEGLYSEISVLKNDLREVKNKLIDEEFWKKDFRNNLSDITDLVLKIGKNLDAEVKARRQEYIELKEENISLKGQPLSQPEKTLQMLKGALITLAATALAGMVLYFITRH